MTPSVQVLETQALCTVQDIGRFGHRSIGVSTCGAMDPMALRTGNILLGNDEGSAAIELPTFPFVVRFQTAGSFAVTGAPCPIRLDEAACLPNWATYAAAGQVLRVEAPGAGARAYLAFGGGIGVPLVLGSRSTYLRSGFGGLDGRPLRPGDVLPCPPHCVALPVGGWGAMPPPDSPAACPPGGVLPVRVMRAAEYHLFPRDMQERFWTTNWRITPQSNRAGYRLSGPPLQLPDPTELRSQPIVPGVVQIPPAGEPIVQLSDANTAGGYPKMAVVIPPDLWRLGQARLGSRIRFVDVGLAEAADAAEADECYLHALRRVVRLQLGASRTRQHGENVT